jgi:3-oxoacyl-[acyl-carrier protein] reductase
MDLGLAGRTYVVTGGSRGLGRATAEVLAAEGAMVVIGSRSAPSPAVRGAVTHVALDVADPAAADQLVATALSSYGRLDGALLSVGGPPLGSAMDVDDDTWRTAFESVFLGPLRTARRVGASLEAGGAIAFVLSTSVRSPIPGLAVSNGLRPGLGMLAKQLADELGPRGVRVNALLPGSVATDRLAEIEAGAPDPAAARAARASGIPLRRYGEPAEFGRVAAFLLSPAASYLSGAMVPVDGGALRSL